MSFSGQGIASITHEQTHKRFVGADGASKEILHTATSGGSESFLVIRARNFGRGMRIKAGHFTSSGRTAKGITGGQRQKMNGGGQLDILVLHL